MAAETRTVTFLFTDIEGSTRLLQRLGADYADVLERHYKVLRDAIAGHGEEMGTEGDGFFAAFRLPDDAVDAAIAIQHAMPTLDVNVRIGIHTGDAAVTNAGYVGLAVHQTARVCGAGHGGQVLLSQATRDLVADRDVRDLGTWRLKDIPGDQRLYQLVAPGLETDFPPLRTTGSTPHNLQLRLTSFVGREDDVAEVNRLLDHNRLVTLAGAGGSGKTRLAAEVAQQRLPQHADGVWWVDLAPLAGDDDVIGAVAATVGVRGPARVGVESEPYIARPLDDLVAHLRTRACLIVLDNCEHVIDGVADVVEAVLGACPGVVVMATSREALAVAGEQAWRIPSLDEDAAADLFVDRARAALASIVVDAANVSVRSICRRLDGMPLAIELAAAKVTVLTVEQIEERLDDRFRLLTGGSRRAMPRQQALRATIDWSYQLLDDAERLVLMRLAVFVGGADLEGIEAVVVDDASAGLDVVDVLGGLVAKSMLLVDHSDGRPRYRFLETIRQYAREKLLDSEDATATRDRHAAWALALVETLARRMDTVETSLALPEMAREYDNLRAALDWFVGRGEAEKAARLATGLGRYWFLRGLAPEALEALEAVFALPAPMPDRVRGQTLVRLAQFSTNTGDPVRCAELAREAQQIARNVGDDVLLSDALFYEGYADVVTPGSRELFEAAVDIADRVGNAPRRVIGRCYLALHYRLAGQVRRSIALVDAAVELARLQGPQWGLAYGLGLAARTHSLVGDYEEARRLFEESHEEARNSGALFFEIQAMIGLTTLALDVGDLHGARPLVQEARLRSEGIGFFPTKGMLEATVARLMILEGQSDAALLHLDAFDASAAAGPLGAEPRAMVLAARGDALRELGDARGARAQYLDALKGSPRSTVIWYDAADGVAACLAAQNDLLGAARVLAAVDELRVRGECPVRPVSLWWRAGLDASIRAAVSAAEPAAEAATPSDDALAQQVIAAASV